MAAAKRQKLDTVEDPDKYVADFLSTQIDRSGLPYGKSTSSYFGNYKLVLTKSEIEAAVQKVADIINTSFPGEKIVLCGILKGAFIFITDLCRRLTRPYSIYFVEASSYDGQDQGGVELLSRIVPAKFEDRRVILIDELLDKGHTMDTMAGHLMEQLKIPREKITTCVLFAKTVPERPKKFDADIAGLVNLPGVWLVGYGLDDMGTKRGWTELLAMPKAPGIPATTDDAIFEESEAGVALLKGLRAGLLKQLE